MQIIKSIYLLLLLQAGLQSCSSEPELPGFDKTLWHNDPKGCKNLRGAIADSIIKHSSTWTGTDDDVVLSLLGKPDKSFFYKRNTKSFVYFISAGKQCDPNTQAKAHALVAEINATGYVSIVRLEY